MNSRDWADRYWKLYRERNAFASALRTTDPDTYRDTCAELQLDPKVANYDPRAIRGLTGGLQHWDRCACGEPADFVSPEGMVCSCCLAKQQTEEADDGR